MLEVKKFSGNCQEILALADVYMRSYNELSKGYKSKAEMALYTKGSFIRKLKNWSNKQKEGNEPFIFVLHNDKTPIGFIRLNPMPDSYRQYDDSLTSKEYESGELDGWQIARFRKVHFTSRPQFDDNTLILNQIYMAPESQKQGFGSYFIDNVAKQMHSKGYDQFVVEYNDNNLNGKKFHENVLCAKKIAETSDYDHHTTEPCISQVTIGLSRFSTLIKNIAAKQQMFTQMKSSCHV